MHRSQWVKTTENTNILRNLNGSSEDTLVSFPITSITYLSYKHVKEEMLTMYKNSKKLWNKPNEQPIRLRMIDMRVEMRNLKQK